MPVGGMGFSGEPFPGQNSYFEFCLNAFDQKIDSPKMRFFVGCVMNMFTICVYILDVCRRYVTFKRTSFWSK